MNMCTRTILSHHYLPYGKGCDSKCLSRYQNDPMEQPSTVTLRTALSSLRHTKQVASSIIHKNDIINTGIMV